MTTLTEFNSDDAVATEVLGACLDIPEWVSAVSAGRPYPDLESLRAAAADRAGQISWRQVAGALARHPRIGEKKAAVAGTATESAWSESEQSGVRDDDAAELAAGNAEYEARFGYIFLLRAAGRSGAEILGNLKSRLTNDAESEKPVVMDELRQIGLLRLAKAVGPE
ncbi:2-oxo-4-hydroxy-4-carboxy-5-ureidoimidazoline decarboxylase [Nakamurella panacisegetis]|uniref:2-oxo-4-hydroxy-4-carboxy-5-ureidoimidazoline decarboxylase n=1 Tax=Nakamurella panacisegetis TaxID=1090615 RepID=A0A1H0K5L4_9ACTN|nr:2-oxo-4-hydroxy-4-carboxy-5-ureidoimidazoline decarboxylase [Nakamurella panacisegetis]SDO51186.1 2-oxo-4-hydroxy-4-carboxy-5-ureidoimidazoline decarboxylase [Nakamurella panacisegetis]